MWDGPALAGVLSPKHYVALTGASSLVSGLILIFEWWYFRKYGTSFIEQSLSGGCSRSAVPPLVEEPEEPNPGALLRGAEGARLAAGGRGALAPRDEALTRAEQVAWLGDGGVLSEAGAAAAQAWGARGAARARGAREALRLDPACAPALLLLAEEEAPTVAEAERVLRVALPAAESWYRALCVAPRAEAGAVRRAGAVLAAVRARLAWCARRLGRLRDAARLYRDLARDDPADLPHTALHANEMLLEVLLEQRAWGDAAAVLARLEEGAAARSATVLYTAALLRARAAAAAAGGAARGPELAALEALRHAVAHNPHVPAYLLERRALSTPPEHVRRRGDSEALAYAALHLRHWRGAEGARRLLAAALEAWRAAPACACGAGGAGGWGGGARRGIAAVALLCGTAALCAAAVHRWPETLAAAVAAAVAAAAAVHPSRFLQAMSSK